MGRRTRAARRAASTRRPELRATVLVPDVELVDETARGLLPATVPHADAAHAAGRSALLVEALTRRPDLLLPATEDRLHQALARAGDAGDGRAGRAAARRRGWPPWCPGPGRASWSSPTRDGVVDGERLLGDGPAGLAGARRSACAGGGATLV